MNDQVMIACYSNTKPQQPLSYIHNFNNIRGDASAEYENLIWHLLDNLIAGTRQLNYEMSEKKRTKGIRKTLTLTRSLTYGYTV